MRRMWGNKETGSAPHSTVPQTPTVGTRPTEPDTSVRSEEERSELPPSSGPPGQLQVLEFGCSGSGPILSSTFKKPSSMKFIKLTGMDSSAAHFVNVNAIAEFWPPIDVKGSYVKFMNQPDISLVQESPEQIMGMILTAEEI